MGKAIITESVRRSPMHKYLVFFLCVLFFSCKGPVIYDQYEVLEDRYWDKTKEYAFTFDVEDTTVPYLLTLEIRNNSLYPFQNLWLFWEEAHEGNVYKRDTAEYMLADDYGKWLGKGFSVFHSSFPLRTNYTFQQAGTYTFSFRQGMRNDQLPGIQEIGLKVEKAAEK